MSNYNTLYKFLDHVELRGTFIIRDNQLHNCWHCGEPTPWIDGSFQAPLCSEECSATKWREYEEAAKQ